MGVPLLKFKTNTMGNYLQFTANVIDQISDDAYEYKSLVTKGLNNGWLNEI